MSDKGGFGDAINESKGDFRVFIALNVLLSIMFGNTLVWGLDYVGFIEYSLLNVVTVAIVLFSIAYLMIQP